MTTRSFTLFLLFLVTLFSFGCGGTANTNTANVSIVDPAKIPTDEKVDSAPTLTPVFKAYCDAWVKKDEIALRKVYSAGTIKDFEEGMKEEKIKSLLKYLEDDAVTGNICEVRNEVITGDKAVAEIRADKFPNGIKIEFIKENGEWKLTTRSPTLDAVKPTDNAPAATANAANKPAANAAAKKEGK